MKCNAFNSSAWWSLCCLMLILLMPLQAHAERFRGIGYLDTLGDVKEEFPDAKYEKLNPAWATESDVLYSITGESIFGTAIIKFCDDRPFWRRNVNNKIFNQEEVVNDFINESDEEALTVEWIKWELDPYVPLERYINKYGKPDKSGYSDDDMKSYKEWTSKGLLMILSDDGKYVVRVDFKFTKAEMRQAYKTKWGFVPDELKEKKTQKTPTKKKK